MKTILATIAALALLTTSCTTTDTDVWRIMQCTEGGCTLNQEFQFETVKDCEWITSQLFKLNNRVLWVCVRL